MQARISETPQRITGTEKKFPNLFASGGGWTTRNDVNLLIGDAQGHGMIELLSSTPAAGTFAAWQAANATTGALNADHESDGVANGIEWFLGGTTGQTALPTMSVEGGATSMTWIKAASYPGV